MVEFQTFTLDNGLKFIVSPDNNRSRAVFNIMYNVGAKDEDSQKTGFAHLFEHLMFRGSKKVPKIDKEVEGAGGSLNAFTNQDITNYYEVMPYQNIETAFWVESDRMESLIINSEVLNLEKDIVTEEFKQSYLNQPYGDSMSLLLDQAFKVHPYKWQTIGKDISHIQNAKLQDVIEFFNIHYTPQNAVVSVCGNVNFQEIQKLAKKYFGKISKNSNYKRNLPIEPKQSKIRKITVHRQVPVNAIYMAFHIDPFIKGNYYPANLICNILSNGESSRFYQTLVKEKKLFSSISIGSFEHLEPGILYLSGKTLDGVDISLAEEAIWEEFEKLMTEEINDRELQKTKNQIESNFITELIDIKNLAINLSFFEIAKGANEINKCVESYLNISKSDVVNVSKEIFKKENATVLNYLSSKS